MVKVAKLFLVVIGIATIVYLLYLTAKFIIDY